MDNFILLCHFICRKWFQQLFRIIWTLFSCNCEERNIVSSYVCYTQRWKISLLGKYETCLAFSSLCNVQRHRNKCMLFILDITKCIHNGTIPQMLTRSRFSHSTHYSTSSTFQTEPIAYELSFPRISKWNSFSKLLMLTEVTSIPVYFSTKSN
jgi:hypothetical protein